MSGEMSPMEKEAAYLSELQSLTDRFCKEYDMSYAQLLGCLDYFKDEIRQECRKAAQEEQNEDRPEE